MLVTIVKAIAILVAAGLAMALQQVLSIRSTGERILRKSDELKQLRALEADIRPLVEAHAFVASQATGDPMAPSLGSDLRADDTRDTQEDVAPGWTLRRRSLSFSKVPLGSVMAAAAAAETATPPWRVTRCEIRATDRKGENAQVELQLDILVPSS